MQRHTPLARNTGLARRRTPLAKKSKARGQQQAAQRRAYGAAAGSEWCEVCGQPGETVHAHLFTQHQREDLRNNPLNWLLMGRYCECHMLQEHNKPEFARRYPDAWARILAQMQAVDPEGFDAWAALHPELI